MCFDFPDSIDGDDVGVLEPSGSASLDQVAFAGLLVGLQVHDELDRYRSVENGVVSEIDLAHPASAEWPEQAIFLERRWRRPALIVRVSARLGQVRVSPQVLS